MTLSIDEIRKLAAEAFTYLYPLVTMDVTRLVLTDTSRVALGHSEPNTFAHIPAFPPADFRAVVRPNFDTLYSSVWLDLSAGPLVVHVPDTDGRYYLLPMLDMWTDVFAVPGKRTTGTAEHDFLLTPPGWHGVTPDGVTVILAPTPQVWIIGRTQTNGPADYEAVHTVQAGMTVRTLDGTPISTARDTSAAPDDIDLTKEPLRLINAMDAATFFGYANRLLAQHPSHITDFSVITCMARIGVGPGLTLDPADLGEGAEAALNAGITDGLAHLEALIPDAGTRVNGWSMMTDSIGVYGNFYAKRAAITVIGLGANPPEDAIYPIAFTDNNGDPFVGEKNYILHFDANQLPPVDAFWSLTMYDAEGFQTANELDRFAIGDRDPLVYGADGSLDLYIQHTDPGSEKTANWLPAPLGPLGLTMRLYSPRREVVEGNWAPPAIAPT